MASLYPSSTTARIPVDPLTPNTVPGKPVTFQTGVLPGTRAKENFDGELIKNISIPISKK